MADVPLPTDPLDDDVNVTGVEPVVDVDLSATSTTLGTLTTGSTTTAGTDVTLALGDETQVVSFVVDTSGAADLTVEVSTDGTTWRTYEVVSYASAVNTFETYETGFAYIRASVGSSLNALEASAKGI